MSGVLGHHKPHLRFPQELYFITHTSVKVTENYEAIAPSKKDEVKRIKDEELPPTSRNLSAFTKNMLTQYYLLKYGQPRS